MRRCDQETGAIRTDFILSAEIIVIALGTVGAEPLLTQVAVLTGIAALMTVGVYGLVAGIVKLDDLGALLARKPGASARAIGSAILRGAPWLMKLLSLAGTAAMFLVGGSILAHGIPALEHAIEGIAHASPVGGLLKFLAEALVGLVAGAIVLVAVEGTKRAFRRRAPA